MKHSILNITFIGLLLNAGGAFAHQNAVPPCEPVCCDSIFCFDPYVGFNGGMRYMHWPRDFGGNVFKRDYPEADVYLGSKITPYLGFQFGYKVTATRLKFPAFSDDIVLGQTTSTPPEKHAVRAQFKGWHAEVLGFMPIYPDCVSLYGSVGFTHFNLFQRDKVIENGFGGGTAFLSGVGVRTFQKSKVILTLGLGTEFKLDERTYFRVFLGWDNTSRFNQIPAKESTTATVLQLKNSYFYGLGVTIRLF